VNIITKTYEIAYLKIVINIPRNFLDAFTEPQGSAKRSLKSTVVEEVRRRKSYKSYFCSFLICPVLSLENPVRYHRSFIFNFLKPELRPNVSKCISYYRSRCSSVSIVSGYGLDDRAIGVRSAAGAKDFSSILCVWTSSGVHPGSCPMDTGVPFPGGKARPGRDADHSPPSSAEVENE
jgi:hypothetical protein